MYLIPTAKTSIAAVLAAAACFLPITARAAEPIIFRQPVNDVFVTGACGFPMKVQTTGTAVVHLFFDKSGSVDRVLITAPGTRLTFTNLDTGKSVWTPSVNMVEETLNEDGTGTKTLRGLADHLTVPGQGLVTADVGRIDFLFTFDANGDIASQEVVFVAGQQDGEFFPTLCSVLGSAP